MTRFHVHLHVTDLPRNLAFYSALFNRATDPKGLAWEQFHTLDSIAVFSDSALASNQAQASACCAPDATKTVATGATGACCAPTTHTGNACC